MSNIVDVSVLITCYNKEQYLNECINSVLRQTKLPKEIIVVHDGCENPMHHAKVTTIMSNGNYGVEHARHEAFRFSSGKLILFLDADDVLSPDYLEKMIVTLVKSKADIVYPDIYIWAGQNSKLTVTPNKLNLDYVKQFEKVVIPVTSLMHRDVYLSLGGFKKMEVLEDLDFFVRAMMKGFVFKKAQTLLWYRRYPGTRNSLDILRRKAVIAEVIKSINEK